MPALPVPCPPLSDGTVSLRLSAERDIPEILIAHQDDPRLHEQLGEARPPTGAQLGSAAERAPAELESGTSVALTITEPSSDVCRGQVRVRRIDWETRRADLEVWVVPQFRGREYAHRAVRLACEWLAASCGLEASCQR